MTALISYMYIYVHFHVYFCDTGKRIECMQAASTKTHVSIEAFCLLLPGRELHLPSLLMAKTFRNRGNKEGALAALRKLENDGLGTLVGENPVYTMT